MHIGIDPGKAGGIAVLDGTSVSVLTLKDKSEGEIAQWLTDITRDVSPMFAVLERVRSSPQMGVVSAFSFGWSFGFLRGLLAGLLIPYEEVIPGRWQKELGCMSKGDKSVTKARAQQLFPEVKCTHGNSDALLIAEYARRIRRF
jgi:crossover junction endodeoxyribonuclease RuvC